MLRIRILPGKITSGVLIKSPYAKAPRKSRSVECSHTQLLLTTRLINAYDKKVQVVVNPCVPIMFTGTLGQSILTLHNIIEANK